MNAGLFLFGQALRDGLFVAIFLGLLMLWFYKKIWKAQKGFPLQSLLRERSANTCKQWLYWRYSISYFRSNTVIMRSIIITIFLFCMQIVYGQVEKSILLRIDSIARQIDLAKNLNRAINEGTINPKGKKKPKGGFSDWYYVDTLSNHLLKVVHEQSLYHYDVDTYYFYQDSLVLAITSRRNNNSDSVNSSGRYYFKDNQLIYRQEKDNFATYPNAFIETSRTYLTEWKTLFHYFK